MPKKMIEANDVARAGRGNEPVVLIETALKLTDINMYRSKFEDLPPGLYRVDYRCPAYNMNLTVSWDGEKVV